MFRRKPKRSARPDNHLRMMESGHGLWTIWQDTGDGSTAFPVTRLTKKGDETPRVFLTDSSAAKAARKLATENPGIRYKVALSRSAV